METYTCKFCGETFDAEHIFEFDETMMCEDCYDEHTAICSICEERIWVDENDGNDETILCHRCYDNHYTHCEECGRLIHLDYAYYEDDSDYPYCRNCYERLFERTIKNYSYKPEPIFYGKNRLYFGVELEVDHGGEDNDNADRLVIAANADAEHIYIKHDGSLSEGFEIVTHPMSLEYHKERMPWADVMDTAINMGYRAHQTSTAGLHVHVNRNGFGETYTEQEDVISRIVYFIEAHWNELLKFSRRTEANINRWAGRYGLSETPKETYDKAKKNNCLGRYVCLNLYNANTIEFRIFRGTLKYETFIAAIELVDEICMQAIRKTDYDFERMCWSDFVKEIDAKQKPALVNYLKSKQLYVNEINESEDEI